MEMEPLRRFLQADAKLAELCQQMQEVPFANIAAAELKRDVQEIDRRRTECLRKFNALELGEVATHLASIIVEQEQIAEKVAKKSQQLLQLQKMEKHIGHN